MAMDEFHRRSGVRWPAWLKTLATPLLVLSVGFHALVLLLPLPSQPVPEVEENATPEEEDAVVDLLSISSLADAEPTPPAEDAPAAAPRTPTSPAAPPAPAQPVAPERYPEAPPPEASPETTPETTPAAEPPDLATADQPPVAGFDPNRQAQLVSSAASALGREPGKSNFDLTEQFPGDIWDLYVSQWSASTQQCFFSGIDRGSYTLRPPAADLRYLSRNIQLVEQQDIPRTFAGQTVQPLGQAYCGNSLFEVQDGGSPILWVSLVPVSPGGSTTLVIFWQADPRG